MIDQNPAGADAIRLHLLVLRCQAGDDRAFGQLFESFSTRTLGYLRGLVGDDAEDVHQDVWLTVYRGIATMSNPRAFRTWLFSITRHRAIDWLRARKRERELLENVAIEVVDESEPSDESDFAMVDQSVLDAALAKLSPTHREVLLLRYQDDMSYAEIALVVGCSIGTVRSRLHHAKLHIQELIDRRASGN